LAREGIFTETVPTHSPTHSLMPSPPINAQEFGQATNSHSWITCKYHSNETDYCFVMLRIASGGHIGIQKVTTVTWCFLFVLYKFNYCM